jgi:hypothetical protein
VNLAAANICTIANNTHIILEPETSVNTPLQSFVCDAGSENHHRQTNHVLAPVRQAQMCQKLRVWHLMKVMGRVLALKTCGQEHSNYYFRANPHSPTIARSEQAL